jgi:cytochrome oxidase Cu insertion factor (SCO1/SenC/PrrC family)
MPSRSTDAAAPRRSSRKLWLILALCAAPLVAAYIAYYFWRPSDRVNYGELIAPQPLPPATLTSIEGKPFTLEDLRGNWVLVVVARAPCDERCRRNLVYTRQVRLASGKEQERIERLWLLEGTESPDAALLADQPGLIVARDAGVVIRALPTAAPVEEHIYVVDPLGNLMMRFPADPDPRRILRDVSRLLRHSKWK